MAWEYNFKAYVPSMLVIDDRLLVISDEGVAACLAASDGKQLWKKRVAASCSASPVLAGDVVYLPDEKGVVHVFKATAEKLERIAKNDLGDGGMASPVIAGGRLYLRTARRLYCIGEASGAK